MAATRDTIRELLNDVGLAINYDSSISDTFLHLIPAALRAASVKTLWECSAPACIRKREDGEVSPEKLRSAREISPEMFRFPGKWQRGSDTQKILQQMVRAFEFSL